MAVVVAVPVVVVEIFVVVAAAAAAKPPPAPHSRGNIIICIIILVIMTVKIIRQLLPRANSSPPPPPPPRPSHTHATIALCLFRFPPCNRRSRIWNLLRHLAQSHPHTQPYPHSRPCRSRRGRAGLCQVRTVHQLDEQDVQTCDPRQRVEDLAPYLASHRLPAFLRTG